MAGLTSGSDVASGAERSRDLPVGEIARANARS
jgi:hypothetical protein